MTRRRAPARCVRLPLACVVALASGAALAAPADSPIAGPDQAAIRSAITTQLDAFRRDDAVAAYRVASPNIEAKFGSAAAFLTMVKAAYPAVYRAHDVDFGPIVRHDGAVVQQVGLVGADGTRAVALYSMEHEANGAWRIDGCSLAVEPSEGA